MLRFKVDLTDFYSDHRSKAFICLRPEYAKIKCLEKYIKKIFDLDNIAITSLDGIYFPSEESIEVLQANDILKVVSLATKITNGTKGKIKKKKKEKLSKQIEHEQANEVNIESNVMLVSEMSSENILAKKCSNISSKEIQEQNRDTDDIEDSVSTTTTKRKRKRFRKKKTQETPTPIKDSQVSKTPCSTTFHETGSKHIRFDDTGNTKSRGGDENGNDEKAPIIKWMNILEKVDKSAPRVIHAQVINRSCIKETVSIDIEPENVSTESLNPCEHSDQQNMCHQEFLKETGNGEYLTTEKLVPNGRDISCN